MDEFYLPTISQLQEVGAPPKPQMFGPMPVAPALPAPGASQVGKRLWVRSKDTGLVERIYV